MFKVLAGAGKRLAQAFIESDQDVFVMTADIDGQEVTVSVTFSPVVKKTALTPEALWGMATCKLSQNTNPQNICL